MARAISLSERHWLRLMASRWLWCFHGARMSRRPPAQASKRAPPGLASSVKPFSCKRKTDLVYDTHLQHSHRSRPSHWRGRLHHTHRTHRRCWHILCAHSPAARGGASDHGIPPWWAPPAGLPHPYGGHSLSTTCVEILAADTLWTTRTYGEIVTAIGNPRASRAVGMACNKNPLLLIVPCHRVVGANGKLVGFAYGTDAKRWLLELESLSHYKGWWLEITYFSPLSTHFRYSLRGFVGEEPIKISNGAFGTFFVAIEKIFSLRCKKFFASLQKVFRFVEKYFS